MKYTLGSSVAQDHYHVGVVRGNLNRHLPAVLEELADEIPHVFKQLIGVEELDGAPNQSVIFVAGYLLRYYSK